MIDINKMAIATEPLSVVQQPTSEERWGSLESFGFPKHYVSPNGKVKNNKDKFTTHYRMSDGSYYVQLRYLKKRNKIPISELVLCTFGDPKPSEYHLIEHIDGDPKNDDISNLKWILPWSNEEYVDDTKEIWRRMDKIGYPNYCVSSFGNFKNATNNQSLSLCKDEDDYFRVHIVDSTGKKCFPYAHILVALTFIGDRPSDRHTVDHINRIRNDNKVGNLRWATLEQQCQNKTRKEKHVGRIVYQYDSAMNFIKKWDSMSQITNAFGYPDKYVSRVCSGKRSPIDEFIWKFSDDVELIPGEIWKPNPFSDCGELVSNYGRIKGMRGFIKRTSMSDGYMRTEYICAGDKIHIYVHRLVIATFVGISDLEVNHKDGNKTNNHISNLEYCNRSENIYHCYDTGLIKQSHCISVFKIIIATGEKVIYPSITNAANLNNRFFHCIRHRCYNNTIADGCQWGLMISSDLPPSEPQSTTSSADFQDNVGENITFVETKYTRNILMIDPVSQQIIMRFTSAEEVASSFEDTTKKIILATLREDQLTHGGYQFVYEGNPIRDLRRLIKKTEQLTLDGDFVAIHDTFVLAAKAVSGYDSNVRNACSTGKPYKNFLWREKELLDIPHQYKIKTLKLKSSV
jgi:hypothetical protein